jgi:hypothetical protein
VRLGLPLVLSEAAMNIIFAIAVIIVGIPIVCHCLKEMLS